MAEWAELVVDRTRCVGTGMCTQIVPDAVRIDREYRAEPINQPRIIDDQLLDAVDSCPAEALLLRPVAEPS